MYETARPHPTGESTVARYAATAAASGFDGVVVRTPADAAEAAADLAAVREAYDVDVVDGVEIDVPDPSQASGHVGNLRPEHTLVIVRGGNPDVNRFAVESPRVDVLSAPMRDRGDFNHVLARAAAENGVHVEFNLARVLRDAGGPRVRTLQSLRKLRELVTKYDAPYAVSADPHSHLDVRAPRELLAVGETIGFTRDQIETGLDAWGAVAARNRERRSESFIAPGVERGRYDDDAREE